jgi:branched-chain amino acid transport system substrate-binding protein
MKRRGVRLALAVFALGALAAVAGSVEPSSARVDGKAAATRHTVKVGIIYSRTGLLSAFGAQYIQGLRLGLEYATKGTNRVNGHKIQITAVDDAGDPAKAVTTAKDLIGRGYKIIGGTVSSGIALQLAPLAEQNKILYISGPAATDAVTGLNRYTFRSGRQTLQDTLAIEQILGRGVGKRIVVFAQDTAFGQGNVAAVRQVLGGRGHTVSSILVPLSASDFTPFAERAKEARPDLLFVAWAGTTAPAMWRALAQQRVPQTTKVTTGLAERATWGSYAPGTDFLSHYVFNGPKKNKVNDWLVSKMRRRGQAPDIFTPDGFVAAQMIVRAVERGGGDNVDRMIRALEGWQFVAPKGVQRIRQQDHAMLQPMFHVRLRKVKRLYVPRVMARFKPASVAPPVKSFP